VLILLRMWLCGWSLVTWVNCGQIAAWYEMPRQHPHCFVSFLVELFLNTKQLKWLELLEGVQAFQHKDFPSNYISNSGLGSFNGFCLAAGISSSVTVTLLVNLCIRVSCSFCHTSLAACLIVAHRHYINWIRLKIKPIPALSMMSLLTVLQVCYGVHQFPSILSRLRQGCLAGNSDDLSRAV